MGFFYFKNQKGGSKMYKLTFFVDRPPNELEQLLKPLGFFNQKGSFCWKKDTHFFEVIPLKAHDVRSRFQGYRLRFNMSVNGAIHLFQLCFGLFQIRVSGVEYELYRNKTKDEWMKQLDNTPGIKKTATIGIYEKSQVGIVVVRDGYINLQVRPSKPKGTIHFKQSLYEIEKVLDLVNPVDYDLFSFIAN